MVSFGKGKVQNLLILFQLSKATSFTNLSLLTDHYLTAEDVGNFLCAIDFTHVTTLRLDYKLRFSSVPKLLQNDQIRHTWETLQIMPQISNPGPREAGHPQGGVPGYSEEGFLMVQHHLDMAVARVLAKKAGTVTRNINVTLNAMRFPFPPYIEDNFLISLSLLFPIIIVFSFIYPAVNLSKSLVIEKERRLKESMKMMGLHEACNWTAHFIKSLLMAMPCIAVMVTLLFVKLGKDLCILNFSEWTLVATFFVVYQISNIFMCFMISTFFSKVNLWRPETDPS